MRFNNREHLKKIRIIGLLLLLFQSEVTIAQLPSQDTLNLTREKAEQLFIENNLQILAQKYNVDATQALIIQAKLYPNPNIIYGNNIYNNVTNQWFPTSFSGSSSDNQIQVNQLIILSRKIHKQVKMAETNYKLEEDTLENLLVTLKFALRSSFYNIYYLQQTAKVYNEEIHALKVIVAAYNEVQGKGYVSEAEIVQIQAQLYSLQNEYQSLIDNINDQESQLRLLVKVSPATYIKPEVNPEIVKADPFAYSYMTLLDSAYTNRSDLMIAKDNLLLSQQTYTYQKALAVPDITVGPITFFTQSSNYIPDETFYAFGFSIPIFNRNQGNIKNARILIDYNNTQVDLTQKTLEDQVTRGLQKAIDADKLYKGIDLTFAANFDTLASEMMKNYMKRNVNLLTFLTFYDSYKQNIVQLNTISFNKVNALENINFLTDSDFFNN